MRAGHHRCLVSSHRHPAIHPGSKSSPCKNHIQWNRGWTTLRRITTTYFRCIYSRFTIVSYTSRISLPVCFSVLIDKSRNCAESTFGYSTRAVAFGTQFLYVNVTLPFTDRFLARDSLCNSRAWFSDVFTVRPIHFLCQEDIIQRGFLRVGIATSDKGYNHTTRTKEESGSVLDMIVHISSFITYD
jgi:hypothetical protein